jgi:hypothetical protein
MKILTALMVAALVSAFALPAMANSYSTTFSNPSAEASNWIQGGTNGVNWNNCLFSTDFAYGSQNGLVNYNDSICVLTGTWGQNQSAQVKIQVNSSPSVEFQESEVHLNTSISNGEITGYEINCSLVAGQSYLQIVRWNGRLGSFTELNGTETTCANGDVLGATRSGSTITAYKNGKAMTTANDTTYMGGAPGIGFYIQTILGGTALEANSEFGASSFTATDGTSTQTTTPPAGAAPSVSISWRTPGSGETILLKSQVTSLSQCPSVTNWKTLATSTGSSYSDTAVAVGSDYCYAAIFYQNGGYSAISPVGEIEVTSSGGKGTTGAAPQEVSPVSSLSVSAVN